MWKNLVYWNEPESLMAGLNEAYFVRTTQHRMRAKRMKDCRGTAWRRKTPKFVVHARHYDGCAFVSNM